MEYFFVVIILLCEIYVLSKYFFTFKFDKSLKGSEVILSVLVDLLGVVRCVNVSPAQI